MIRLTGPSILSEGRFLNGVDLLIDGDRIHSLVPRDEHVAGAQVMELEDGYLLPGFVDLQVNGGGGRLFNHDPTAETLGEIARAHRRFGSCAILPTLISDDDGKIAAAIAAVEEAIASGVPGIIGLHLEGPALSSGKAGIHDSNHFRPLNSDLLEILTTLKYATLVTLAPELTSSEQIRFLTRHGVRVSLGHSLATYEQCKRAEEAGLSGYTHLFNAMPQINSRAPGPVVAALEGDAWCGIIVDGHHVDYSVLRMAVRAKRSGRFCLVTDAMVGAGSNLAQFQLAGRTVRIAGSTCLAEDGTLAGSNLTMIEAVRNTIKHLDVGLADAVRWASSEPASFLGLKNELGDIRAGLRVNLIYADSELSVRGTFIGGRSEFY